MRVSECRIVRNAERRFPSSLSTRLWTELWSLTREQEFKCLLLWCERKRECIKKYSSRRKKADMCACAWTERCLSFLRIYRLRKRRSTVLKWLWTDWLFVPMWWNVLQTRWKQRLHSPVILLWWRLSARKFCSLARITPATTAAWVCRSLVRVCFRLIHMERVLSATDWGVFLK